MFSKAYKKPKKNIPCNFFVIIFKNAKKDSRKKHAKKIKSFLKKKKTKEGKRLEKVKNFTEEEKWFQYHHKRDENLPGEEIINNYWATL